MPAGAKVHDIRVGPHLMGNVQSDLVIHRRWGTEDRRSIVCPGNPNFGLLKRAIGGRYDSIAAKCFLRYMLRRILGYSN